MAFLGAPFIKVLAGVRRCGKSSILEMIRDELIARGANEKDIIHINLELHAYKAEFTAEWLAGEIEARTQNQGKAYLLLDEVQLIAGWERVVNAFFAAGNTEIFITGSNSQLLSSELASLLSGRYVQFVIRPLSFGEYLDFIRQIRGVTEANPREYIREYLKFGGFPAIHYLKSRDGALVYKTVADIYATVVLKDVILKNEIRNADMLERIIRFLFSNVGNLFSARSISDYFKSQGRKVSVDTILEYISALESAYIIEKAKRYDIKGKKLLNVREKYYLADVSLLYALLGYDDGFIGAAMENVVYSELRRRGYEVSVGQYDDKEVDFVCTNRTGKIYVQVAYTIGNDPAVIEREFGNLLKIADQYPKYVVSLDIAGTSSVSGVQHVFLSDFLLGT
jgi:predicted AAA+ superfamily ATPase